MVLKNFQLGRITEKAGFVGSNHLKKLAQFCSAAGIEAKVIVIFAVAFEVQVLDAVGEAVLYKVFTVFGDKNAALLIDEIAQLQKFFICYLEVLAKRRGRSGARRGSHGGAKCRSR